MPGTLLTLDQTSDAIRSGQRLLIAGATGQLEQLPAGDWIGGSTTCFLTTDGGVRSRDLLFVKELPDIAQDIRLVPYDATSIEDIYRDAPHHGFTVAIIPALSKTHLRFALEASHFPSYAASTLIGWISTTEPDDVDEAATVFLGPDPVPMIDGAVALHVDLPPRFEAVTGVVNLFTALRSEELRFPMDGFAVREVLINDVATAFPTYLERVDHDRRLPLICPDDGTSASFAMKQTQPDRIALLAPIFSDRSYHLAMPVFDLPNTILMKLEDEIPPDAICFASLSNHLAAGMDKWGNSPVAYPCTAGEIAPSLRNQTIVWLTVRRIRSRG
jgi:hypothetical protein